MHCLDPIKVAMKDALLTNIDFKTSELIVSQYGHVQKSHEHFNVLYSFSEHALIYTYAMQNLTSQTLELSLDLTRSEDMVASINADIHSGRLIVSK